MIFHAPYLSSREMPNINICILQFFRNFPSLEVSQFSDFYFDLSYRYILFVSPSFFFSVSLLCLSILLLAFELMFVSVFGFPLVFVFLLSLHIALSSGFEFIRSPFMGGSSALTATVLVES